MDTDRFVAGFSADGTMTDIPAGVTLRGTAIGGSIGALAAAFPDVHRELFEPNATGDVVVAELTIRGTQRGAPVLSTGPLAATGRTVDVPRCDVFHLQNGKVASFHCYDAASVTAQRLEVAKA